MRRSYVYALILAVVAVGWVASGFLAEGGNTPPTRKPPAALDGSAKAPTVRVRRSSAERRTASLVLRGRSEALRSVEVKAETKGRVVELLVEKGRALTTGQIMARLAPEDRPAALKEAEALLGQRRIEYEAALRLSKKGFRAETQLAGSKAALESAEAAVEKARIELANTEIAAPFEGILEERMAEIGDFVDKGDAIARVVDLDPILIVADVNERDFGRLEVGAPGTARLITGNRLAGTIRFLGAAANQVTRTFRVELEVDNPDGRVPAGVTAELDVPVEDALAHRLSPAVLTLTDEGQVGVKTVEAGDTVAFRPVEILESGPGGLWVTGLPENVTVITVGHEFVTVGQTVRPVEETGNAATAELGAPS